MAVAPAPSATAKRHNIDVELQNVSSLVGEMLTIAKQSYSTSLTASHMGRLALELNVTIAQLRRRIDELQREVRSWVLRLVGLLRLLGQRSLVHSLLTVHTYRRLAPRDVEVNCCDRLVTKATTSMTVSLGCLFGR